MKIRAKTGKAIYKALNLAYWPNPEANESAHREAGDAAVDSLTIAQLRAFFEYATFTGPVYCMVKRRVGEFMEAVFPEPNWAIKRTNLVTDLRQLHRDMMDEIAACQEKINDKPETTSDGVGK
jgi:hypothetical protein